MIKNSNLDFQFQFQDLIFLHLYSQAVTDADSRQTGVHARYILVTVL